MYPPSQDPSGPTGVNLEDRLRGLILSNANVSQRQPGTLPDGTMQQSPVQPRQTLPFDRHQQLGQTSSRVPVGSQTAAEDSSSPGQPSPTSRKRLNQAQRRQMNSQLSIPIDTRPVYPAQTGRGIGAFGAQHHNQRGAFNQSGHGHPRAHDNLRYQQHQQQSPHFQNPSPASSYSPSTPYSQGTPNSPMYHPSSSSPQYQSHQSSHQFQQQHHQQQSIGYGRGQPPNRQLYQPGSYGQGRGRSIAPINSQDIEVQSVALQALIQTRVADVGIAEQEGAEKEAFRSVIEKICQAAITEYEQKELGNENFNSSSVELSCFGSMKTGFATKGSDLDLALISPKSQPGPHSPDSPIPRLLEKRLLDLGYGARLLTRARVPIIKLCELPNTKLLAALLEARTKWENGFTTAPETGEEALEAEVTVAVSVAAESKSTHPDAQVNLIAEQATKELKGDDYDLAKLKQKDQQSLREYYLSAKRLLQKLGGRDVTAGAPDLNEMESKILNVVSGAFISGLNSDALATRLRNYKSIWPLFDPSAPFIQRSLAGVVTQCEGERLAMFWDCRPLTESNDSFELQGQKLVEDWRSLQDDQEVATETVIYNKQLIWAADKLKSISSVRLMSLEQIHNEAAIYYHTRAQKLLSELKGRDYQTSNDTITPIVISHYISGIWDDRIRQILQGSERDGITLDEIGFHHQTLELANDYERALKIKWYDQSAKEDVEKYISLLRSRKINAPPSVTDISLVARIRALSDPTKALTRNQHGGQLEFPKSGIGIQCDINFSAHLAIHNTQLLRCYSHCDPRVRELILFVKHWATTRGINTPYRGTLSSYGYVLMVLHYLVNVAQPFVCPNLQAVNKDPPSYLPPDEIKARTVCNGRDVRFWRNEAEIKNLAERKMLNHNHQSAGHLLRGFFEYFAQSGEMSTVRARGFDWGREVLSIRTMGGILTKQEKGWVGAKTVVEKQEVAAPPTPPGSKNPEVCEAADTVSGGATEVKAPRHVVRTVEETKEIRHRYLFAIEDPFELDHNVARTVTHDGIVTIRDEFRRSWRIIQATGKPYEGRSGGLLDPLPVKTEKGSFLELLEKLHGPNPTSEENIVA